MFEANSLTKFFRKALSLSERGTIKQQDDLSYLVSAVAHYHEELKDVLAGKRKDQPHHPINSLREFALDGTEKIKEVAKEIDPHEELPPLKPLE